MNKLRKISFDRTNRQRRMATCTYTFQVDKDRNPIDVMFAIVFNEHFLTANIKNLHTDGIKAFILHEIMHAKDVYTDLDRAYQRHRELRQLQQDESWDGVDPYDGGHDTVFQGLIERYGHDLNINIDGVIGRKMTTNFGNYATQRDSTATALTPAHVHDAVIYICPICGSCNAGYTFDHRCKTCGNDDTIYAQIPPSEIGKFLKLRTSLRQRGQNLTEFYLKWLTKYARGTMRKRLYDLIRNGPEFDDKPEYAEAFFRERAGKRTKTPVDRVAKIRNGIKLTTANCIRFGRRH